MLHSYSLVENKIDGYIDTLHQYCRNTEYKHQVQQFGFIHRFVD